MCLIVVGALAPLCFLFSVFQHARPPATPRRLGLPLTERSKTLGLASGAGWGRVMQPHVMAVAGRVREAADPRRVCPEVSREPSSSVREAF